LHQRAPNPAAPSEEATNMEGIMRRYVVLAACAVTLAIVPLAAWGTNPQEPAAPKPTIKRVPAEPLKSLEGVDIFRSYCAVCHGETGVGNGPAARGLTKQPANLTTITKRHGMFPRKTVEEIILADNEAQTIAHGTREMPMWGPVFRKSGGRDVETLAVANLLKYIESIQEK
jgi:mono/diheme cytochrome c family protein